MSDKRKPPSSEPGSSPYVKRPRVSYAADDDDEELSAAPGPYLRPRSDPVYGQKSAFPGLDDPVGDELFYGPAEDGMEYLRMVRSEANSLPTLFVAPKQPSETIAERTTTTAPAGTEAEGVSTQDEEQQGFYYDGVYIARPITTANGALADETSEMEELQSDAQASYYASLRERFLQLRSTLRRSPPASAVAALDDDHPISLPRGSKAARSEWRRLLLAVDPQTVQLACMDMQSVLGVLSIMGRLMSENVKSGDAARVRRIGAWAWGLLARCRDVGQLSSEEVGEIRDLGKRAAKILRKMKEERMAATGPATAQDVAGQHRGSLERSDGEGQESREESHDTRDGDEEAQVKVAAGPEQHANNDSAGTPRESEPEELEAAKARLQARLQLSQEPEQPVEKEKETAATRTEVQAEAHEKSTDAVKQTRAMLDMILTVVGEFYGQRDLLEAREIWDEDTMR
ncbi:hypothetical protein M432DRAFT_539139 [Thermoascus aurantiacus ATCC 26904]